MLTLTLINWSLYFFYPSYYNIILTNFVKPELITVLGCFLWQLWLGFLFCSFIFYLPMILLSHFLLTYGYPLLSSLINSGFIVFLTLVDGYLSFFYPQYATMLTTLPKFELTTSLEFISSCFINFFYTHNYVFFMNILKCTWVLVALAYIHFSCFKNCYFFNTDFSELLSFFFVSFFAPQTLLLFAFIWNFLLTVVGILLATALLTLLERKIMASIQRRRGPNVIGFFGLLQPFADGLKLAIKETTVPRLASKPLFILGPIISFGLAIFGWSLIPFPTWLYSTQCYEMYNGFSYAKQITPGSSALDLDVGLLFLFVVVALHVYGVLFGGWGSNSRYALLGALRATAQSISYELVMGFTLLILSLCHGGFSLVVIVYDQSFIWNIFSLLPIFFIFYVCALAELNRTPFDLVEAEGELVAGYNVEYSAMMFALYFLGEYISIIFSAFTMVVLFLAAWFHPFFINLFIHLFSYLLFDTTFSFFLFLLAVFIFVLKVTLIIISSLLVRFVLPRYRYDQLMNIGWLVFLPISLFFLLFYANIVLF